MIQAAGEGGDCQPGAGNGLSAWRPTFGGRDIQSVGCSDFSGGGSCGWVPTPASNGNRAVPPHPAANANAGELTSQTEGQQPR